MICPKSKDQCNAKGCAMHGCYDLAFHEPAPKPTMAEIERLVDALVASSRSDGYVGMEADQHLAARAALMAAIRSLSNSTQDGE